MTNPIKDINITIGTVGKKNAVSQKVLNIYAYLYCN